MEYKETESEEIRFFQKCSNKINNEAAKVD